MENKSSSIRLIRVLKQVADVVKKNIQDEFSEMDLTGSQGMLVGALAHHGEMKISDLSERMGLSLSTVSGIIDRLEKQGYVERIRSEEDRRVVLVRVTSEFKKRSKRHYREVEKKLDSLLNRANPAEAEKIFAGLEILRKIIDQESE